MDNQNTGSLRNLFAGKQSTFKKRPPSVEMVTPEVSPVATIKVVGVGGGGCNAISRMMKMGVKGIEFIAMNTDAQALYHCDAPIKLNAGKATTRGLGAGGNPDVGRQAAEESSEEIKAALDGADMVFIAYGLGGGTGTGGAPVVAEVARELGILTVAVVTKPFSFEGLRRKQQAEDGLENLRGKVDTLIIIPNDRILSIIDKKTPLVEAFSVVDDVLRQGVQGIVDIVSIYGDLNVDFADVKAIMQNSGSALMGIGYGAGENRAMDAAKAAIESPLLEMDIGGAKGILINVTGGNDLSMFEVDEATRIITEAADPDANIKFGFAVNDSYTGEIKITVIATGFDDVRKEKPPFFQREHMGLQGSSSSSSSNSPSYQQPMKSMESELDVPVVLRKRIS